VTTAYNVQVDEAQVAEAKALFEFVGGNSDEALRVAINRTTPRTRTIANRTIRTQVRLPLAYVAERLSIIKATRKSLNGRIRAASRGLLLSRFSTDALIAGDKVGWIKPPLVPPGGIRVKVKPDGPIKVVHGDSSTAGNTPFYIVLNKGANVGIAARLAGQGSSGRKVKVFSGPSVSQVFDSVRDEVLPGASDIFQEELLDAMRYLLAKKYPPEGAEI
jgi:hypothetical protein